MAKSDKTMRSDGQRLILGTHAAGVCVRHNFEGLTARMLVEVPKRAIALIYSLQPYEETHGLASNITHVGYDSQHQALWFQLSPPPPRGIYSHSESKKKA